MVEVKFNLVKRDFVWMGFIIVLLGVGFGYAFGGVDPSVMGHSAGEIDLSPMHISGNNIGIGTASPIQKLDVVGNVKASGNMMASKYCDENGQNCKSTSQLGGITDKWGSCYYASFQGGGQGSSFWWGCNNGYYLAKLHTYANAYSWEINGAMCCRVR